MSFVLKNSVDKKIEWSCKIDDAGDFVVFANEIMLFYVDVVTGKLILMQTTKEEREDLFGLSFDNYGYFDISTIGR